MLQAAESKVAPHPHEDDVAKESESSICHCDVIQTQLIDSLLSWGDEAFAIDKLVRFTNDLQVVKLIQSDTRVCVLL